MSSNTDLSRLSAVQTRLADALAQAGRTTDSCELIVVSKTQSAERMRALVQGQTLHFGENYLAEALDKIPQVSDAIWHFIGAIQSNKTAAIAENFDWVHTLDRGKIARRLNDQRPDTAEPLNVLIQVNVDNEPSKAGVGFDDIAPLAATIAELPRLRLRGLMSIPAPSDDPAQAHRALREALEKLQDAHPDATELSMGMSGDMPQAVAEGATFVRIGTAIFGPRQPKDTH